MREDKFKTMQGLVCSIFGAYYDVLTLPDHSPVRCTLKGKLRIRRRHIQEKWDHIPERNPIYVGDIVEYEVNGQEGVIRSVLPRKNSIVRASRSEIQGLGANLDRAVLVMSMASPVFSPGFVDRFIASCYAGGVDPLLVFTKWDLPVGEEADLARYYLELYTFLGYQVVPINLLDEESPSWLSLKQMLSSGVSLLAGRSGTGKSTLMNRLLGGAIANTQTISRATDKGRHTTTNSILLQDKTTNAFYIDTPGVKEWGVMNMDRAMIFDSFPEFRAAAQDCQFADCVHEPDSEGCAVRKLMEGAAAGDRVSSVLAMISSLKNPDRIRPGDYKKPTGRLRTGRGK